MLDRRLAKLLGFVITVASGLVYAHGGSRWGRPLDWHTDQIDEVITGNADGQERSVEGRECVSGTNLSFKVNDRYAFDIDEAVSVDLEFYLDDAYAKLAFHYDSNVPWKDTAHSLKLPQSTQGKWYKQSLLLERARFAKLLRDGADFAITVDDPALGTSKYVRPFTICSLTLRRSYKTPEVKPFGQLSIEVFDENGQRTPARIGLYETSGRLPLPSDDAILLKDNEVGKTRITFVGSPWPAQNRSVFYANGHYHTKLPAKTYDLIVAKGSEYRFVRRHFTLSANESKVIQIRLQRWTDMAARGWYSGDDHIHYERSGPEDDRVLAIFTRGEDLKVANILEFDDALKTYFPHYDWKTVRPDPEAPFVLAPGQEAPRTSLLGHTTELNIHQPIRDADHYLLYHRVFEQTHAQGGLAGFAHLVARPDLDACYAPRGMPIDVPFGLVDFVEIFTNVSGDPSLWFDYLNLGYKITPTAGTDWPWGSVPGTARNYVKIDGPFAPQAWFDGLKAGRTFTSSGPMIEFSINGDNIGSELHVLKDESLDIRGEASLNPDLGMLLKLELIEQGESVKAVSSKDGAANLEFHFTVPAKHGTWFVLRAWGKDDTVLAVSAPIYVRVDGHSFWKVSAVPTIVAKLKAQMNAALNPDPSEGGCSEGWYTQETITQDWNNQKDALKQRINQASAIYDDLVNRATAQVSQQ